MAKKEIKPINKVLPVLKIFFKPVCEKYPFFFVLEVLKMIISIAQPFIAIIISPMIVDELLGARDITKLITLAVIMIVGEFLTSFIGESLGSLLSNYQERLNNLIEMELSRHSMNIDFQLTEDKKALDQLHKAQTGIEWYSGGAYGMAESLFGIIGNVIKIVSFTVILCMHAPLVLVAIVIYVIVSTICNKKVNEIEFKAFSQLSAVNRLFGYFGYEVADFSYGKDIRLYEGKNVFLEKWDKNIVECIKHWRWQARSQEKVRYISTVMSILRIAFTYLYTAILVLLGHFTIGTYTQIVTTAGSFESTLGGLVYNIIDILKKSNYAYEYYIYMNYPEAMPKGNEHVAEGIHEIEFRNVSFAYPGTEKKVLDNVNIKINPGEHLSIVGLNGAGKTTFIKLLCRLYDPTEGTILLNGKDIKEYEYKEYVQQYAPVFQDFKLFGFTVLENVVMKDSKKISDDERSKMRKMIDKVELTEFLDKLPKAEDTQIFKIFEEDGIEPSGGEQQKLAFARALYKDSQCLILDEPTAALDPIAEYEIYHQFDTLVGDKTTFYISHRLSSCRFCDRIAVFAEGTIKELGTHDTLVTIPGGIYAGMFEAQAQYYR